MSSAAQAAQTQLANIERKTGKTLPELASAIARSGKDKHGEIRAWLMEKYGLGHGDANALVHFAFKSDGESAAKAAGASNEDVLAEIYSGKKAHLRAVHDKLMAAIVKFGALEIAPKKGYVSLRRKKQFAMLGPKTNERFELGLNLKAELRSSRIIAQPPGGMCQYIAPMTSVDDVTPEIIAAIKQAYDAAG